MILSTFCRFESSWFWSAIICELCGKLLFFHKVHKYIEVKVEGDKVCVCTWEKPVTAHLIHWQAGAMRPSKPVQVDLNRLFDMPEFVNFVEKAHKYSEGKRR